MATPVVVFRNPLNGARWRASGNNIALLTSWGWVPVDDPDPEFYDPFPGYLTGSELDPAVAAEVADGTSATAAALRAAFAHLDEDGVTLVIDGQPVGGGGGGGGGGLTTEQVQDLVAAMVLEGANVTKTYDDTAGTLTIEVTSPPDASTTVKGLVELATNTEATTGTDTARAVTPSGVAAVAAGLAPYRAGLFTPPAVPVRVVSTCDSGWTQLDATVTHDTTVKDTGAASLKLVSPVADKAQGQLLFTAQDWSKSAFSVRLRFDDYANVNDAYILLSTSGTFTQFFRVQLPPNLSTVVDDEWFEVTLTRDDFTFNSGTADWATVNGIRVQVFAKAGVTATAWIDQVVRYPTPARPTISICTDDGFATTATVAKPKMDQHGFRGTAFIITQRLGTNGYLSQAQVDDLAQAGWDISGHGNTNLSTITLSAAEADVAAQKKYLVDRGYKGGDVYSYPNDGHNFAIRTMVAKYFGAARGLMTFGQTRGYVPRRRFNGLQAGTNRSLATMQAWVDRAIATNSWLIITFHSLPNSTSLPEDWLPADFNALMDYIAATGVPVLPISEALAHSDAPPMMRAANGTQYRLDVDNSGALVTTAV